MKKGVFGVGPKEIAYGYYDGDTVEVCTGMDIIDIRYCNLYLFIVLWSAKGLRLKHHFAESICQYAQI